MKWLDVESVRLPERAKIFTVCRNDTVTFQELLGAMADYREKASPEELEAFLRAIVVSVRNELAGCTIVYMGYDEYSQLWEIGVTHASLPMATLFEALPRERLVPLPSFQPDLDMARSTHHKN